jgi:hypothetical protein
LLLLSACSGDESSGSGSASGATSSAAPSAAVKGLFADEGVEVGASMTG